MSGGHNQRTEHDVLMQTHRLDNLDNDKENGSITMFWAIVLGGIVLSALVVAFLLSVSATKAKAQAAADLAALAGANRTLDATWQVTDTVASDLQSRACAAASQVANAQNASLNDCWVNGADVYVKIQDTAQVGPFSVPITAKARAGPN